MALGGAVLVGCGDSSPPATTDSGTPGMDAGGLPPDWMDTPESQQYVVSTLQIPEPSGDMAAGFNLDGEVTAGAPSGTCVEVNADYTSVTDTEIMGVDNALGPLVPTIESLLMGDTLDNTLATQITEGSLLILMEVTDINSYIDDPSVSVQLSFGEVPGGGAPMLDGTSLAAGQMFTATPVGPAVSGRIVGGRLIAQAESLTISIDTGDFVLDLNIRNAEIRGTISADTMTVGAIGGSIRVEDVAAAAEMIMAGLSGTVRSVLSGVADIDPITDCSPYTDMGACENLEPAGCTWDGSACTGTADETICDKLSVGILFGAIDASF